VTNLMRHPLGALPLAGFTLIIAGCSSGPQPPQPGTPPFLWAAAKTAYGAGDYRKASDNLTQLTKSENEFAARALPLSLVLEAGIARGYIQLADSFDTGAKANRTNPAPFRRQATVVRGYATTAATQAAEMMHKLLATDKSESLPFEFPYPAASAGEPVQLQRVEKGMLFPDAEIEALEKAMVGRGVQLAVADAVGAGGDPAKAQEIFQKGEVKVARPVFVLAMAKSLVDAADLFSPKKLDQPNRVKMLCDVAEEALKTLPDSKEKKDLAAQIAKTRKASKVT
jgi:hypothetical protein